MPRYLISFDNGSMKIPEEDLPQVSRDSHAVVAEAKAAGVWIFGGGIAGSEVNVVDTDGAVRRNPYPADKAFVGGFSIIEVPSHEEALRWAEKFAVSCRCAQDVRQIMHDPES
jgi:hypothetical protein